MNRSRDSSGVFSLASWWALISLCQLLIQQMRQGAREELGERRHFPGDVGNFQELLTKAMETPSLPKLQLV